MTLFLGPFQPSHKLMLKFYAYYKQATEGRCSSPKPAMWNVIGGRKWFLDILILLFVDMHLNIAPHIGVIRPMIE